VFQKIQSSHTAAGKKPLKIKKKLTFVLNAASLLIKVNAAADGSAPISAESGGGTSTRNLRCHIRHIAPAAVKKYRCAARMSVSTAPTAATSPLVIRTVAAMADALKIQAYQSAMSQVRNMLRIGIIDKTNVVLIENKLAEKYGLKFGSIYREIDLINVTYRANMV
jgi:hypothetical protein